MKIWTKIFGYIFVIWRLKLLITMALILGLFILGLGYANLTA